MKIAKLNNDTLLVLWEKWTPETYVDTYVMRINADGELLSGPHALGPHVRLHRRDDPYAVGDSVYIMSGSKASSTLTLHIIDL